MRKHLLGVAITIFLSASAALGDDTTSNSDGRGPDSDLSVILGRPTERAVVLSILSADTLEASVEYGTAPGVYAAQTSVQRIEAAVPFEFSIEPLKPDTRYHYRVAARALGEEEFHPHPESTFHTQRAPASTFVFALQGDSHPEREGRMYCPDLYLRTMRNVVKDPPDFYLTMGDDFSLTQLMRRGRLTQEAVDSVYVHQRGFLGVVGRSSPLLLVNGNHEHAARYLLDGTADNAAVMAGRARTHFFPLPAPDGFYSGNAEQVEHIGLLRDYYAWTWGDALFVVIDPYWHSPIPVDNPVEARGAGQDARRGRGRQRDFWAITLGDTQYRWLSTTLTDSQARWKFVFCHHVLGTGRGGIEMAGLYEWGGKDERGVSTFADERPGWELPIHQLMVKTGVTIFFQGHDHLFAKQELDGVIYQACPNPADPTYQAFNRDAYRSGVILPNSGHLRVSVCPATVRVDYVRSYLLEHATAEHPDGEVAFAYEVTAPEPTDTLDSRTSHAASQTIDPGS